MEIEEEVTEAVEVAQETATLLTKVVTTKDHH
jgi:hypothetical protein